MSSELEVLRRRIQDLETLCSELYRVAVESDCPQPLLNLLWTIAESANLQPGSETELPNVSLVHRPAAAYDTTQGSLKPLKPLAQRYRVMIVDDDPIALGLMERILKRENYEVLPADSGKSALALLEQTGPPDLLITDYNMPSMTGRQLAELVRQRVRDVKVLYQTGFSDLLFSDRRELEPNAAFIEKPYTARGLLEAARLVMFGTIHSESPLHRR